MIHPQATLAHLVLEHSECAPILQRHRLDFCCRGDASLASACEEKGLDVDTLLAELSLAIAARRSDGRIDPRTMSSAELVRYIVAKHHAYLRTTLPFLMGLSDKVSRVHGKRNAALREIDTIVRELSAALIPHLDDEEETLFPALLADPVDRAFVVRELASMHEEHLAVGELLARLRVLAEDFAPPIWACNSYRTLCAELEQLEADTLEHVHLENHVLMPRFAAAN